MDNSTDEIHECSNLAYSSQQQIIIQGVKLQIFDNCEILAQNVCFVFLSDSVDTWGKKDMISLYLIYLLHH